MYISLCQSQVIVILLLNRIRALRNNLQSLKKSHAVSYISQGELSNVRNYPLRLEGNRAINPPTVANFLPTDCNYHPRRREGGRRRRQLRSQRTWSLWRLLAFSQATLIWYPWPRWWIDDSPCSFKSALKNEQAGSSCSVELTNRT